MIEIIGYLAAFLTTAAFLPQVYKVMQTKSTEDLSLVTFSMLFVGVILWVIYGFILNELPIIIANLVMIVLSGILLTMKILAMIKQKNK